MSPTAAADPVPTSQEQSADSSYGYYDSYSRQPTLESIENKVRSHILIFRVRLTDQFADFDRLRTGYVSESQFRRCVGLAMDKGVVTPLTEEEFKILMEAYKGTGERVGRVKWTAFVDSIDKVFGAKKLESTPTQYIPAPHEVVKPVRPLTPASQSILNEVIERLRQYVKHHGSDLKSWFKDFDRHNNGLITYNQFRRGIPQNLMSPDEEDLLLSQYTDEVTQTVNYFKMNTDVNRKVRKERLDNSKLVKRSAPDNMENEHVPVGTEELLHAVGVYTSPHPTVNDVEDVIKKQVYKDRIRLIEFFRDYDRHNCGYVTPSQFHAGIGLAKIRIDDSQVKTIIEKYKNRSTNLVAYRKFCADIDKIFTVSHLERNPTAEVQPPPREYLIQGCNELSPVEEARCREIIARFRQIVNERRILLAPYFKDFDKCLGNIGRVTRSHFSRLLSTLKLDVSDNDLHILFKKFEDRQQAKVDYMEFIRTIDPQTYASNFKARAAGTEDAAHISSQQDCYDEERHGNVLSLDEIIETLRFHVGTQRIRVSEFFKDFDKLRCYSIPKQEFIRAVDMIGISLSEEEYELLAETYKDEKRKGCCKWKDFEQSMERVFTDTDLERNPTKVYKTIPISNKAHNSFGPLTPEEEIILNNTLKSITEHMRVRQTSIKPFFKDFDKLYTGHVTKTQFRQCLTYLQVNVTDAEFEILCKRWSKSLENDRNWEGTGQRNRDPIKDGAEQICYLTFLEELEGTIQTLDPESSELPDPKQAQNSCRSGVPKPGADIIPAGISTTGRAKAQKTNIMAKLGLLNPEELQQLMMKIKSKARTERIRVIDFMQDFDHLRHGKITRNEFRRALKVLYLDLSEVELATLETQYQNARDTNVVDYQRFSDDVESVFTAKGLEKDPTKEPAQFDGYLKGADPSLNILSTSEKQLLEKALRRLRERVRQRRIDLLSYMEDYDFVKEGTITTNQFRSALNTNNLAVDDAEIRVMARRFTIDPSLDRINYRAVATAITGKDQPEELSVYAGVTRIKGGRTGAETAVDVPVNTFGIW
ncbi:hypothetical protein HDU97_003459 [Phlyctochytrium planicorne]|nr:hypothetical protein HDU97_003459 [Phlyctochytrium planicorne]